MTALKLISLLTLACLSGPLLAADKDNDKTKNGCVRVVPKNNDIQAYDFDEPGNYCVEQDFYVQTGYSLSEGWRASVSTNVMLFITSSDVIIDLQGHELKTNSNRVNGVRANPDVDYHPKPPNRIVIRNGTIDLRGGDGVSLISQDIFGEGKAARHQAASLYSPANYLLENLTIKTSGEGIILVGKNSIVRNCKIEAGNGAVQIYGPGAQVLNNKIVLNSAEPNPNKYGDKPPIALILHDAEGTVVSGNTITVKGKMKNAQAILLKRSPNVRIENNKIRGVAEVYAVDDTSTPLADTKHNRGYAFPRDTGPASSALLKDNVVNPSRGWFPF